MSLQCRIVYKNDNTIDYLETPQGERSELFDELVQVMGGDKDSALNMYALTESEDFKTLYNGYVENKPSISVAQAFNAVQEMQAIKDKAIADGTFMKAPNGQPTNLNEQQWLQVRTRAFKEFFGDWINDPQNASKVVDNNGEPLVVYHGSPYKDSINIFETKNFNPLFSQDLYGAYTTEDYNNAKFYSKDGNIYKLYVNIRNPYNLGKYDSDKGLPTTKNLRAITKDKVEEYLSKGFDGVIFNMGDQRIKFEIVSFNPNQIKSAEENIGTFSTETNDIRFSAGENQGQRAEREVIDRLKQNGLANNVFEMNTQEINAKLEELGVDAETRKQVIAYHGSPYSFDRLLNDNIIKEVTC